MSNPALAKFRREVKAYRKKHPAVSQIKAQKKISKEWKAKPAKRRPAKKKAAKKRPRKISGVRTISKSHVDKNRFKNVDIQIGSVKGHLSSAKKILNKKLDKAMGDHFRARTKPGKKKIAKRITSLKSQLRRLD